MVGFLISIIVISISLLLISKLPIGVLINNPLKALISGAIIGAFDGLYHLIPGWLRTIPAVLSFGLIPLIVHTIIFAVAAWLVEGFRLRWGLGSAILGAIALAVVNFILFSVLRLFGLVAA
ncbi:MAG TPA: phage holin family protein [Leptolyngbyaceae cyanobacterium M33_DOE_097]|uniref:Phage holin family protein n=1 Tax=Oscillatoriales cyanobacterium SpSt-418 TaxID=2282169 RepID=A0A7C3KFH1_9CYAN|nr:phage holin family protein [Leptolyngbyaceae cyanobacterium M33_DOE_097]